MRSNRFGIASIDKKTGATFVVGRTLPKKLHKATQAFFETGVTPQLAYDAVAKIKAIEEKLKKTSEVKTANAC